jgi:hypothetical protein
VWQRTLRLHEKRIKTKIDAGRHGKIGLRRCKGKAGGQGREGNLEESSKFFCWLTAYSFSSFDDEDRIYI